MWWESKEGKGNHLLHCIHALIPYRLFWISVIFTSLTSAGNRLKNQNNSQTLTEQWEFHFFPFAVLSLFAS